METNMSRTIMQSLAVGLLLIGGPFCAQYGFHGPLASVAHAEDSDNGDDNGGDAGGGTLSPDLQWSLVSHAWDKREYDDAAVLGLAFADANPDHPSALDALWRAYTIYHAYRPNPDKAKAAAAITAVRGEHRGGSPNTRVRTKSAPRCRSGTLRSCMTARDSGTRPLRPANRLQRSFPARATSKMDGGTLQSGCSKRLAGKKRSRSMKAIANVSVSPNTVLYRSSVRHSATRTSRTKPTQSRCGARLRNLPKYNWAWGQMGYGAIDAAHRLIVDGAPDVSRQMAMGIVDKSPKEGWAWPDLQAQARALLGEAPAKSLFLQPYMYNHYATSHVNIEGSSKLTLAQEPKVLVSVKYASATDPIHALMTFAPKVDMKTIPTQVTKVDGDKPTYTMAIDSPDAKGTVFPDQWIGWMENDQEASPPASLVLTRKWEKQGSDWGTCTIRIQSSDRWNFFIYLPNAKTNANNCNIQPNEVNDGGATFRYYNWYDLTQGMTIKFPITVGTQVTEYYPKILAWLDLGRGPDISSSSTDAKDSLDEYTIDIKSDKAFPTTFNHPVHDEVLMSEISK